MGLFNKNQNQEAQPVSQRQRLEGNYAAARKNILLVLAFTTINLILLVANSNTYFLFSAYIPFAIVDWGMFLSGRYPAEVYSQFEDFEPLGMSLLVISLVIAVVICLLYLLCWLFSDKKRVGWLITALVLFATDTILMLLGGIGLESIMDVIFHGWVIISLSMGISAYFKLKKLPPEEEPVSAEEPASAELTQE
jgi:hypothetical protein